ncbi:hypothetical protein F9L04_18365 [Brucella anthropi]|uniref:Uncharacterized protein n=2 Tax=Hyphomicrobiales TaxID=356 RepID=A0A546XU52_AGRTU|nr:hypothetical protein F9L04_18365 [Brucella anthropi]TRB04273.1 hypothetical protein EXN61_19105 [Agrobacterium tumefaciens]
MPISPAGAGFLERNQLADAYALLWIDGELVHLEDLVLHGATRDPPKNLSCAYPERAALSSALRKGAIGRPLQRSLRQGEGHYRSRF